MSVTLCSCAPMGSIMMSQQGRTLSLPLPACLPPTAYYGALAHPTELAFSSTECSQQTCCLFIHRQPKLIPGTPPKKSGKNKIKLSHWMNLRSSLAEGLITPANSSAIHQHLPNDFTVGIRWKVRCDRGMRG